MSETSTGSGSKTGGGAWWKVRVIGRFVLALGLLAFAFSHIWYSPHGGHAVALTWLGCCIPLFAWRLPPSMDGHG